MNVNQHITNRVFTKKLNHCVIARRSPTWQSGIKGKRAFKCISEHLDPYRYRLPQFLSCLFLWVEKFRNDVMFEFGAKTIVSLCLIMFCTISAFAQGTNDVVTITKEYEGKVKDADKVSLTPNIPEEKETTPKLTYNVPERDFKDIAFEPNQLRPLGMSTDKLERYNSSYIRLGVGSQLTALADLMYNGNNKANTLRYGFFYDHLSQYGFKIKNEKYSDDNAGAYLKYFVNKLELSAGLSFHNLRTHFYGSPDTTYAGSAILQNLRNYDLNLGIKNSQKNKLNIDYFGLLRGNFFQETYGGGYEYFINWNVGAAYNFKKFHSVFASFQGDVSSYDTKQGDTTNISLLRTLFYTKVGYGFNNDDWKARAAFTLGVDGSTIYGLPDLYLEKRLYQHKLLAYLGWEMRLDKNSFQSLSAENNYVNSVIDLKNTRVSDVYAGLKGTVGSFSYNFRFAYKDIYNMAFFYTNYFDTKRFYVSYDPKVTDLNGLIELGYNYKETMRILWTTDLNSYTPTDNQYAWYAPVLKTSLKVSYIIEKKIIVGADIYAFSNYEGFLAPYDILTVKATADVNLNVEYLFNKRLSFFGKLNNLANQRYQIYANYPVYGINGLVGAKFSF